MRAPDGKPVNEGDELFYRDAKGRKRDAELHARLLRDDATAPEDVARLIERAVAAGLGRSEAAAIYGGRSSD